MGKFPRKIKGFLCGTCDEFYEDRDDADECCKQLPAEAERWQCIICDEKYEDRDDAYHCCD